MKKIVLLCGVLIVLMTGCCDQARMTAWLLSGPNVSSLDAENEIEETLEYKGRVGLDFGQLEAGLGSHWWMGSPRQSFGAYILQFLSSDPNAVLLNILPLDTTYIGAEATLGGEVDSGTMLGFVTGTLIPVTSTERLKMDIATEFIWRTFQEALEDQFPEGTDRYKIMIGPRWRF